MFIIVVKQLRLFAATNAVPCL